MKNILFGLAMFIFIIAMVGGVSGAITSEHHALLNLQGFLMLILAKLEDIK